MDKHKASIVRRAILCSVFGLTVVVGATHVRADEASDARQAATLYREGRYDEASVMYARLSVQYPQNMAYLWNLGACYYYSIRADQAISTLRQYIAQDTKISVDDRKMAEQWIAEMEARKRSAGAPVASPPPPSVETQQANTAPPAPSVAAVAPAAEEIAHNHAAAPQEHETPALVWIAGGVGAAALVGGVVSAFISQDKFSQTERRYDADAESSGKTFAKLQVLGYSVGVAGLVTAAVVYFGNRDQKSHASIGPLLTAHAAGATYQMRF